MSRPRITRAPRVDDTTDANGRSLHGGLFRERCTLRARDPATFLCAVAADVPAGSEELVLDETRLLPEVRGVVVDRAGRPVGGAALTLNVDRIGALDGGACLQSTLDVGTSDEHGRFALQGVAHEHVRLSVRGEGVERAQFELEPHRATALELTVGLELRYRLGETFPARADAVEARDERDAPLTLTGILPDVTSLIRRLPLGGRFARAKLEVSDAAVELVYLAGDEVPARRPLELRRGEVFVVEQARAGAVVLPARYPPAARPGQVMRRSSAGRQRWWTPIPMNAPAASRWSSAVRSTRC